MGIITFNGKTSSSIGLQVEIPPDYEIPERIYETVPIPGRNGDLVMDTGAYKNVPRKYEVSIGEQNGNFSKLASKISGWLHSAPGYLRLEDSYEPDHYKLARYAEESNIINILQQAGKATITFDRKPQRFLKSGDVKIVISSPKDVSNPTSFNAKPLLKVNGTGDCSVSINDQKISIKTLSSYMYIDCDREDAYKGSINTNNLITLNKGFPILKPGVNKITITGSITSVEITPRWWTI